MSQVTEKPFWRKMSEKNKKQKKKQLWWHSVELLMEEILQG